jgi:hypothetical protein
MRPLACLVALVVSAGSLLRAQTVVESFNYTVGGGLVGNSGGSGFSTGWSLFGGTDTTVASGSLASSTLTTAGNKVTVSGAIEANRTFNSSFGAASTTVWTSVLVSPISGSDYAGVYFGAGGAAMFLGVGNGGSQVGAGIAGSSLDAGVSATPGSTYLLVLEMNFVTGTSGSFNLYVNPTNSSSPGSAVNGSPVSFTLNGTNLFGLYAGGMSASVDEFRLGGSYGSVVPGLAAVPEPATNALLAATAALALAAWRRRAMQLAS